MSKLYVWEYTSLILFTSKIICLKFIRFLFEIITPVPKRNLLPIGTSLLNACQDDTSDRL
ncbi:hypothetical protein IscW_ISCW010590 [Ixodes scapularis]|uniref:Uncharacterized protein n=1 Tax=Ixodes scapularis TaxID=6945 RepID=B7Q8D7_IXOSC|nr:hypothetical protein IscW_ISCW010590 [Ixodes scapularis]|eukprot:XP_002404940.1 hypothetical protein IscW_ISCW010590 [Ixodes scapularis]